MTSNNSNNQENKQKNLAVLWDSESNLNNKFTVYTRFLESRMNAYMMPSKKHLSGTHVIDRGFLLLQRTTMDDILFLSLFSKEKADDVSPDFIIPIGMIAKMDTACVKSGNGTLVKGRVTLITHTTVDARLFLGPIKITIHLSIGGMQALEAALQVGASYFPGQQKKVISSSSKQKHDDRAAPH